MDRGKAVEGHTQILFALPGLLEHPQVFAQFVGEFGGFDHIHPGRGKLERQWHSVEQFAHFEDGGGVFGVEGFADFDLRTATHEQFGRVRFEVPKPFKDLAFWAGGLALNALWSWLFFGQHMIGAALIDIVLMWCTIIGFIVTAYSVSGLAAGLFGPYLVWVSFATAVNAAVWLMNK